MSPQPKPESTVRRLFRERELRRRRGESSRGPDLTLGLEESLATTLSRVEGAAAEMDRLRAKAASQQDVIYDQKQELATVRLEVADALDQAVRSDSLYISEKIRAELADARAEQLEREVAALRTQISRLTTAVSRSFDRHDKVVALHVVA